MRAAVYHSNSDIRIEDMPVPEITGGEILVKVHACGICGSDVMEWYRKKAAPRVLGHEVAGEVVKTNSSKFNVGDRVFVTHHVPCNQCHYCRIGHQTTCDTLRSTNFEPGGFAEYLRVPAVNVERGTFNLPDKLEYGVATFIEPLACVYRGQRLARLHKGSTVLVLGSGISGILHIALAKAMGAGKIMATDISQYRMNMAKQMGASLVLDAKKDVPSSVLEENGGRGVDVVISATGARQAINQAFGSVGRGGTILWFAPTDPDYNPAIPFNTMWKDEISTVTSYAAVEEDILPVIELLAENKIPVEKMITHRLPLEETAAGFQMVASGGDSLKVIIEPSRG